MGSDCVFIQHECRTIAILNASRVDDDTQRQAFRIDQGMQFAALQFLTGIIPHRMVMTAPFSADFSVWLSSTAAVGFAWRPRRRSSPWRQRRTGGLGPNSEYSVPQLMQQTILYPVWCERSY
jgi:hypothetical protein